MPTLFLVRHAQASFGSGDYDVLTPLGLRQAEVVAACLATRRIEPSRLISGPRRRQLETARVIGDRFGLVSECLDAWDEYDAERVLAQDGRSDHSLASTSLGRREFQELLDGALLRWAGDGREGGWGVFRDRSADALVELADSLGRGEAGIVVTSAGVIAAIACVLLDLPPASFVALNRVAVNTAISVVAVGSRLSLLSLNEYGHLGSARSELLTYR